MYKIDIYFINGLFDSHSFDNFIDASDFLEYKILEIYDSENYTTIDKVLNKYDLGDRITENMFDKETTLRSLNSISGLKIKMYKSK